VSVIKTGVSAFGKLLVVAVLAITFLVGLVGVVYLSLRGQEVKVPEIVGRDFYESEKELAQLGLKLKKRATRYSQEKPNTVLEQLPRSGETVKTDQTILVVLSQVDPEGQEAPATIKKQEALEAEEAAGTDIAPDKPKKTNKNANTNKKTVSTTRDVISNKSNKNSNANSVSNTSNSNGNSNSKTNSNDNSSAGNKNGVTAPANKTTSPPTNTNKSNPVKTNNNKTAPPGEDRTRQNP